MDEQDLINKVGRHIRPIIESPDSKDGVLQLEPLDPRILELVPMWYPDKTPARAVSDFLYEAAAEKAGLI